MTELQADQKALEAFLLHNSELGELEALLDKSNIFGARIRLPLHHQQSRPP